MNPLAKVDKSWHSVLHFLYQEPLKTLSENILPKVSHQPKDENIFNAFQMPLSEIKVVILGQDPYPVPGDAIGYAFATSPERRVPSSLKVIQKELKSNFVDIDYDKDFHFGDTSWKTLSRWRESGVFLLNTALTVETGKASSHLSYWENFTRNVIQFISSENPCIWFLWGKKAQAFYTSIYAPSIFEVKGYSKETIEQIPINWDWNYVFTSPHPAAELYSGGKAGFYNKNHFLYANTILKKVGKPVVTW